MLTIDAVFHDSQLLTISSEAAIITVDDSGGRDHNSIQAAIDAASDGDTVYVYAGTYHEDLIISGKTINLTGENKDTTVINSDMFNTGLRIESDNNNISGFTVTDGWWGIELNSSANTSIGDCKFISNWDCGIVLDRARANIIEDCHFENNDLNILGDYQCGILIGRSNNNTINSCTFTLSDVGLALLWDSHNNTLTSNSVTSNDYNGLSLKGGEGNTLIGNYIGDNNLAGGGNNYPSLWIETDNNIILKNRVDANFATGIYMKNASGNQLNYNNVTWNTMGLALLEGSGNNLITGNDFGFNDENGIAIHTTCNGNEVRENAFLGNNLFGITDYPAIFISSDENRITSNTIDGNDATGIYLRDGSNNTVDNNTATNSLFGIYLYNTRANDVENNTVTESNENGCYVWDSSNITLFNNTFRDNLDYGVYLLDSHGNDILRNDVSYNSIDTVWDFIDLTSFEGADDEGWVHGGQGDCWERGVPASGPGSAHDGTKVWATNLGGNYGDNANFALSSPSFNIGRGQELEFWHSHELEDGWDFSFVEISNDGGSSWIELARYTGDSGGWAQEVIPLVGYEGDILLRFRLKTDANLGLAGWYIDQLAFRNTAVQDFEGVTDDGWTHGGTFDTWERGGPVSGPDRILDGGSLWGTDLRGHYENNSDCSLYSPEFDLVDDVTLSFFHWYDIEEGFDEGLLEISDDGGVTWDLLVSFDGSSEGWDIERVSLGGYSGNVRLRFRLNTDGSVVYAGWYIDQIAFLGGGGIHVEVSDGNTISNNICNQTGARGIYVQNSRDSIIDLNHCGGNRMDGITLDHSRRNSLGNNTVANNRLNGIHAKSSHGNEMDGTGSHGNVLCGINLTNSNNNTVSNSNITHNKRGIEIGMGCDDSLIYNNSISENLIDGIRIHDCHRNRVIWNAILWNDENGGLLESSDLNVIDNNTIFQNWDGMRLLGSDRNEITGNLILNNWNYGMLLDPSSLNNITDNNISHNWNHGLAAYNSVNNDISGNDVLSNLDGIYLNNSDFNLVSENLVDDNWDDGISLDFSWGCTISRNVCSNNWWYGIYLYDMSSFNVIDNNTCTGNVPGIILEDHSWSNLIENNTCSDNVFGIYIYESEENTIIYNTLSANEFWGVVVEGNSSEDNLLHHNNFLFNNGSSYQALDAGINNTWDDGRNEGNFWENYSALYPQAINNDHIWDTPYDISGDSGSCDEFPLYYAGPGADDEAPYVVSDDTPAFANTGDSFTFRAELEDNLGLVEVNVRYSYDGISYTNVSMDLARGNVWTRTILISETADELYYSFHMKDLGRNDAVTGVKRLSVYDNDEPYLVRIDTADNATTGDTFLFSAVFNDNIQVTWASVRYSYHVDYTNLSLLLSGNAWSATLDVADDAMTISYYFMFGDGTNTNRTSEFSIPVLDNDAPEIVADTTPSEGSTGDEFTFDVELADNMGVDSAWVNHSEDDGVWEYLELEEDGGDRWYATLMVGENSTFMEYYITAVDINGNELVGSAVNRDILDNDPPAALAGNDLVVEQDREMTLDGGNSTDNMGIDKYVWTFDYDGTFTRLVGEKVDFTFEIAGTFMVYLNVSDLAGNSAQDIINITVVDRTPPRAEAGEDVNIEQHGSIYFNANESEDNVGIASFLWSFDYDGEGVILEGPETSYVFDFAGEYEVILNVTDVAGNWAHDTLLVTVKDITEPQARAGGDMTAEEDSIVFLNGNASSDNVEIISYIWNFTYDGKEQTLKGDKQSFNFRIPGNYTISLTVTDPSGNSDTDELLVTVREKVRGDDDTTDDDTEDDDAEDDDATGDDDGPGKSDEETGGMGSWMQDNMFLLIIVFGVVLILIVLLLLLILRRRKRSDEELLEEADGEDELEVEAVEVKTVEGGIEADEGTGSRMELAAEEMKRMEETFEGCREAGMDLTPYKERYEEIRDAVNIEDPEMTAAEITEFITKLDEAYYAYFDELKARAKKLHETLNNEFRKAASHGIDVKGFRGDYESGIKCFKGRDFQGAIELFRYVLDALGGQGEEKAGTAQYEAGEEGTAVDETSLAITDDRTVETAEATAEVTAEAAVREEVKAREKPAPVRKVQRKVIRPAAKKVNLDSLFAQIQPRGGGSSTGDAAETAGEGEVTGSE